MINTLDRYLIIPIIGYSTMEKTVLTTMLLFLFYVINEKRADFSKKRSTMYIVICCFFIIIRSAGDNDIVPVYIEIFMKILDYALPS